MPDGFPQGTPTEGLRPRRTYAGLMSEALLVVAHGSHLNPASSVPAQDHADRIRAAGAFDEVREAYWKEEPSLRNALRTVVAGEVYVVPLFVSEGYFTEDVIPRELRLEFEAADWDSDGTSAGSVTLDPSDVDKTVHYCGPVGTHDAMSDVIVRRAESVTGDPDVGPGVGLAVVGHGTKRNENSAKAVEYHADRVRKRDRFAEVRALFMDEDPEVDDLTEHFGGEARSAPGQSSGQGPRDIAVVPLFIADGYHTQEDIPEDIGLTGDASEGYDVPARVDGHDIWYAGAIGTEPLMADVIIERAADAGADVETRTGTDVAGDARVGGD
jgi:sirohydrochlorin cobaltochelatase